MPSFKDRKSARAEIERNDAAHRNVIERLFQANWRDPEHYDLVLNTERLSIDACVDQVSNLVKLSDFQQTESSRRQLSDRLIEFRIRGRLSSLSNSPGLRSVAPVSVKRPLTRDPDLTGDMNRSRSKP